MLQKVFITFFCRSVGAVSALLLSILLGRLLGAAGSGQFFLLFTILTFVGCIGGLGFELSLIRFIGVSHGNRDYASSRMRLAYALKSVTWTILLFTVPLFLFSKALSQLFFAQYFQGYFEILACCVAPFIYMRLFSGYLKGSFRPAWGALWDQGGYNLLLLLFVAAAASFTELTAHTTLILFLAALLLMALFSLLFKPFSKAKQSQETEQQPQPADEPESILKPSITMMVTLLVQLITGSLSLVILGYFSSDFDVGIYTAAYRLSILLPFFLLSVNTVVAPRFASYYADHKLDALRSLYLKSTLVVCVIVLPVIILLYSMPEFFLGIFGPDFVQGAHVLRILLIGQLFSSCTGSVGYLMTMTGKEKPVLVIGVVVSILTIGLSFILIPAYGLAGAAWVTTLSLVGLNSASFCYVNAKFGMIKFLRAKIRNG